MIEERMTDDQDDLEQDILNVAANIINTSVCNSDQDKVWFNVCEEMVHRIPNMIQESIKDDN